MRSPFSVSALNLVIVLFHQLPHLFLPLTVLTLPRHRARRIQDLEILQLSPKCLVQY